MKLNILLLTLFFLLVLNTQVNEAGEVRVKGNGVYIVYMGGPASPSHQPPADLLISILQRRDKNAMVHSYKKGFSGFAARLTQEEAEQMGRQPGVVSVFPDPILKLHTTHSWDFLLYQSAVEIQSSPSISPPSTSGSADTIIGILDTGIWPESQSFNDKNMGPIPLKWKGICMVGDSFNSSNCNRKLIGARYYKDPETETKTARDFLGHGTHVASTAGGTPVSNASYLGLASGTAKGGSPASRVAMYRVCTETGCRGSAILAAFDDAISDGVDVLSLSLGSSAFYAPAFSIDPIAIGAFHAIQNGITVVCSAGNDGPDLMTVVNVAPWILTVAATTIDRVFQSNVVLGNAKVFKGEGINFANTDTSPVYPLITGLSAKSNNDTSLDEARQCYPGALDGDKIKGKIVVCEGRYSVTSKAQEIKSKGGVGIVLIDDILHSIASKFGSFPLTVVSSTDGVDILSYINSTSNPVGTIIPTRTVTNYKPAPIMAYFSSRGPSYSTKNILKPDIAAPGVNILAAWLGNDTDPTTTPSGMTPPPFNLLSGTSMSCPHVSGVAASIKSQNPNWSPAAIRSAIMTTAIQTNNMKTSLTTHTGDTATPYEYGAGEVNPSGALDPGLVYDIDPTDYLQFLCFYGYNASQIKLLQPSLPEGFACPKDSNPDMIWNINYPSIAIYKDVAATPINVTRMLTNVGQEKNTLYNVSVAATKGLTVNVEPQTLRFTTSNVNLSYQVTFSSSSTTGLEQSFGMITWSNGKYKVSSPFVVSTPN